MALLDEYENKLLQMRQVKIPLLRISGVYMTKRQRINISGINQRIKLCVHLMIEIGDKVTPCYGEVFNSIGDCERAYDLKRLRCNRRKTLWNSAADEYTDGNGTRVRYWYAGHPVDDDCSVVRE